jgi:hypothetical protein
MFNREAYKNTLHSICANWTEVQLDEQADFMEQKYKTVKSGDNVVHLEYFNGLINDAEIEEIESALSGIGYQFSRFDKSGIPRASIEEFTLQVALYLNNQTTQDILLGLGTSLIWDTLKKVTISLWERIRNKTIIITTTSNSRIKDVNFGIKVKYDKNTFYEFKLDGNIDKKTLNKSLDKIIDFLKTINPNENITPPEFIVYNQELNAWVKVDVLEEIRKKIKKDNGSEVFV